MHLAEARLLLGFPPNSHPSSDQVKAAYKKKVWDYHPDRFPACDQKAQAESKFKSITEAYSCLVSGGKARSTSSAAAYAYGRVRTSGVPASFSGGRKNPALISFPFLLIIFGTVGLGGFHASRAYTKQKDINPLSNPFLP